MKTTRRKFLAGLAIALAYPVVNPLLPKASATNCPVIPIPGDSMDCGSLEWTAVRIHGTVFDANGAVVHRTVSEMIVSKELAEEMKFKMEEVFSEHVCRMERDQEFFGYIGRLRQPSYENELLR